MPDLDPDLDADIDLTRADEPAAGDDIRIEGSARALTARGKKLADMVTAERPPSPTVIKANELQQRNRAIAFTIAVVRRYGDDSGGRLAALLSFYAFFSLFPLMLALVTVLGYVLDGRPKLQHKVVDSVVGQFPVIGSQLKHNMSSLSGSGIALAVGVLGAMWSGLKVIDAASDALNTVGAIPKVRRGNVVVRKLRGMFVLVLLGGGLVGATVATSALSVATAIPGIGKLGLWAVSIAVNVFVLALAFRILPDTRLGWRAVMPGALFGGFVFFLLASFGGVWMHKILDKAGDTYGVFALVIGLLSWMLIQSSVTILAAEINAVKTHQLYPRRLSRKLDRLDGDERDLVLRRDAAEV